MSCDSPQHEAAEGGPPGRLKKGKKCGGCKGKKPCAKCSAAKAMKEDALTTKEYLAACDLGVEHKSRTYIRARLDAMAPKPTGRSKKCGNSHIPINKKCIKAGEGGAKPVGAQAQSGSGDRGKKIRGALKTAGKVALVAGAAALLARGMSKSQSSLQSQAAAKKNPERDLMNAHANKAKAAQADRDKIKNAFAQRNASTAKRRKNLENSVMKNRAAAWGDRANKRAQTRKAFGR